MSSVLRSVRKRKKGRTLGAVDVIDRAEYAELEVDAKVELTRISVFAVVPYGQDKSARLDFRGSDVRNPATEGDTLWVNYSTRRFSSRSVVF